MTNLLEQTNEPFPSIQRIAEVMRFLIEDLNRRDEVSTWASQWLLKYDDLSDDDHDGKILSALSRLSGADAPTIDRPYLYDVADFERWLSELEASA